MGKESLDLSCFNIVGQTIVNSHTEKLEVESAKSVLLADEKAKYCKISFEADVENAGGLLFDHIKHGIFNYLGVFYGNQGPCGTTN